MSTIQVSVLLLEYLALCSSTEALLRLLWTKIFTVHYQRYCFETTLYVHIFITQSNPMNISDIFNLRTILLGIDEYNDVSTWHFVSIGHEESDFSCYGYWTDICGTQSSKQWTTIKVVLLGLWTWFESSAMETWKT